MLQAAVGLMALSGLAGASAQAQNAREMERAAEQAEISNRLNETMEAQEAASVLSTRRTYEAASGLTDMTGSVMRKIRSDYLRDKAIREYNAAVEGGQLRAQARNQRLRAGASALGAVGSSFMMAHSLGTPAGGAAAGNENAFQMHNVAGL